MSCVIEMKLQGEKKCNFLTISQYLKRKLLMSSSVIEVAELLSRSRTNFISQELCVCIVAFSEILNTQ